MTTTKILRPVFVRPNPHRLHPLGVYWGPYQVGFSFQSDGWCPESCASLVTWTGVTYTLHSFYLPGSAESSTSLVTWTGMTETPICLTCLARGRRGKSDMVSYKTLHPHSRNRDNYQFSMSLPNNFYAIYNPIWGPSYCCQIPSGIVATSWIQVTSVLQLCMTVSYKRWYVNRVMDQNIQRLLIFTVFAS